MQPDPIADKYVDIVEAEGVKFVRVKTGENDWTMLVSPSGEELAKYQAKSIRKTIALAIEEVRKRPPGLLQRLVWWLLWA